MVVLTEGLVMAKTKTESLDTIKNLNACGQGIEDVSVLQQMSSIEVLSLSVNKISTLRHFAFCGLLKQLYLRANAVNDLSEIRYLMPLRELRVLWLADNPCTKLPHYRAFVVANLPKLENLDNVAVNDADRQAAKGMRLLQPATAADVLAEEREAAEQLLQQQLMQADGQTASSPLGSRPSSATSRVSPLPSGRRRSSNSASTTPTAAASAGGPTRRGSGPRSLASPEPSKQQFAAHSSSQECQHAHSPPVAAYTSLSAPPSATGSCRTTPEPHDFATGSIHRLQQPQIGVQMHNNPRGYSITPRDLGSSASCAGVPVSLSAAAGSGQHGEGSATESPPRQLYGEHSHGSVAAKQFLLQAQHNAIQQRASLGVLERQQSQSQSLSYPASLLAEHSAAGAPAAASTRTSVLYAVMALLGELDVSSLHIVQREVQARLMDHHHQQQQQH